MADSKKRVLESTEADPAAQKKQKIQKECALLFVCGDKSGIGKSSLCMGILKSLLQEGFSPSDLAYIKPATQCEDVQLVWKFCNANGIACEGVGPIRFYQGFTHKVIEGKEKPASERLEKAKKAIDALAKGRKLVLIDGVGYPAVGSVAGVSNAHIAAKVGAKVVVVGRPGVGDAIDSLNFILAYFKSFNVPVVGAVWNRLGPKSTYHSLEDCVKYVSMYVKKNIPDLSVYGFIPLLDDAPPEEEKGENGVCVLKTKFLNLEFTDPAEKAWCDRLVDWVAGKFDGKQLVSDLQITPDN